MDDTNGRVTIKEVYDLLSAFRAEMMAKFDELPTHYSSRDQVSALERRIGALEDNTVPLATHNVCFADVGNLKKDVKSIEKMVWKAAGVAAAVGVAASVLVPLILRHFIVGG